MVVAFQNIDLAIYVYQTESATEDYTPWQWDKRNWTHIKYENSDFRLPVVTDQSSAGLSDDFWQSGVGNLTAGDLKIQDIAEEEIDNTPKWVAKIQSGEYYRYNQRRYLFSDRSVTEYPDGDQVSTRYMLDLAYRPAPSKPILARSWRRMGDGMFTVAREFLLTGNFTGTYNVTTHEQYSTVNVDMSPNWTYANTNYKEFVYKPIQDLTVMPSTTTYRLWFNQNYIETIGLSDFLSTPPTEQNELIYYCEELGTNDILTTGEIDIFETEFFPMYISGTPTNDIALYYYNGAAIVEAQYGVDYIVEADRGFISINYGTGPCDTSTQQYTWYIVYKTTLEVEYEPAYDETKTELITTSNNANLNPLTGHTDKGLIFISEEDLRVDRVELVADAPVISDDLYGPLNLGTDYSKLTATAYNINGAIVPGVEVEFYTLDPNDDARLNGALATTSNPALALTNSDGQASVYYTTSRSLEAISEYVTKDIPSATLDISYNPNLEVEQLYVYMVFDDDLMQPWDSGTFSGGRKVILYTYTIDDPSTFDPDADAISATAINPNTGLAGAYVPIRPVSATSDSSTGITTLTFPGSLPVTDITGFVAYWVVGTKQSQVQARIYSTLHRRYVESNEISLNLQLPEYMKGTYISGDIEIPFGWRLPDAVMPASAISAATYLTINPRVGLWPVFDTVPSETGKVQDTNPFEETHNLTIQFTVGF